jgi:UDP-N-acetylmuramoyl-L-alanyl-D-glutamate--2,6-diaminopimelate ligase
LRLLETIEGLPITATSDDNPEVLGITQDSRFVEAGYLFVALVGKRFDGRAFIPDALQRGAIGVVASGPPPPGFDRIWLTAGEPRWLVGPLAARIYRHPDRELLMAGITGTNGKTTVSRLLVAMLEAAGHATGSIGTLGHRFAGELLGDDRTTPEASHMYRMLRRMVDNGATAVSAEISSQGLALGRVAGLGFDLAIFTNLTRDHLDFHRDLEDYFQAKRRLFDQLKPKGVAVVNIDDPRGRQLADELPRVSTYGDGGDVSGHSVEFTPRGISGVLTTPRGELEFESALLGDYNLQNIVAAAAGAEALGLSHPAIGDGIRVVSPLPGRLEPVDCGQPFPVLVDYAHTDAAMEAALRSLRSFSNRKILLVFGCGGDRDPGKRPLMGRIAGRWADLSIITSDNPRGEDPLAIIAAIEKGVKESGNPSYRILPDRREAIRRAIAQADQDWVVLIAGKGHEIVQIVGEKRVPFVDREEIEHALEEKLGTRTDG